jgi:hypothetical protein
MRKKIIFFVAVLVAQTVISPIQVVAQVGQDFLSNNEILFSDPRATRCAPNETLADSDVQITKSETLDEIFEYLTTTDISTNNNQPLSDVQASGIMGNMYAESGFQTDAIEVTDREDKGHGLVQWTFGRWDALQAFAESSDTDWTNLDTQLRFIKEELETTESALFDDEIFTSTTQPSEAAVQFRIIYERANPELANDSKRTGAAIAVFNLYGSSVTAECISGNGIVAGNLVETAVNFALEEPADLNGQVRNTKEDARDTYQIAKPELNPTVDWTDCGGFIATVMFASKVDPNYKEVGVEAQSEYVKTNSDKYLVIETPTLNDLQPGDILFTPGHTTMYTGKSGYPSVDASLGERVPSVRDAGSAEWMINNGAFLARVIR